MTPSPLNDFERRRAEMVERHVESRRVHDPRLLEALRAVPREVFLPEALHAFAYADVRVPLDSGQSLPRPGAVALMLAALEARATDRVLEIGLGTGYVTALLARLAQRVYALAPQGPVAAAAARALDRLRCGNVLVRHAPAEAGWPEQAPFDAILVHGSAPQVPAVLQQQLAEGGRLVMALGTDPEVCELVRVTRLGADAFRTEDLADIAADPALGEEPHASAHAGAIWARARSRPGGDTAAADRTLAQAIAAAGERFATPATANLEPLLQRIGDARVVLLGEATHGSSDFYRMRDRITRELITRKGFAFVAIEGDWPDAARIDRHVRGHQAAAATWSAFARFPTWMWRNQEVRSFVDWLRLHNAQSLRPVAFHGLDLYSLHGSIHAVLAYLDEVDPATARVARRRYGCLTPWQSDPAGAAAPAADEGYRSCEQEVVQMLVELTEKRPLYTAHDGERLLDLLQNARVVRHAERYHRTMYYGSRAAWNLRDSHMFETLKQLLAFHGAHSKAVVWAHNSHVGDSAATEMSLRGEFNLGHLCRAEFGPAAYLVGFGTHGGTVAAASDWDAPMQPMTVQPALAGSYEALFHDTGVARFLLPLRRPAVPAIVEGLSVPRLERAIGVIYRTETERQSHYFDAVLPGQFDEYLWFDETRAVTPLKTEEIEGMPETYPFGL